MIGLSGMVTSWPRFGRELDGVAAGGSAQLLRRRLRGYPGSVSTTSVPCAAPGLLWFRKLTTSSTAAFSQKCGRIWPSGTGRPIGRGSSISMRTGRRAIPSPWASSGWARWFAIPFFLPPRRNTRFARRHCGFLRPGNRKGRPQRMTVAFSPAARQQATLSMRGPDIGRAGRSRDGICVGFCRRRLGVRP